MTTPIALLVWQGEQMSYRRYDLDKLSEQASAQVPVMRTVPGK